MQETVDIIQNFINNSGFPILAALLMFFMYYKQDKQHDAERTDWQAIIMNNTNALHELSNQLKSMKGADKQ